MKQLVLASIIAVVSALSFGLPAQAGDATVTNAQYVYRSWGPGPRYYGHRYYGPGYYGRWHRYCHIETIRHHRYGRWWVERVRVCR